MNSTPTATAWQAMATVMDTVSARALVERLQMEGILARFEADTSILGEARACRILVPAAQAQRARWVLSAGGFSDAELLFLATGESDLGPSG